MITRSGASLDGVALTLEGGTLGTRLTRASQCGRRFANGVDFAVSGTYRTERRRETALLSRLRRAGDQQRHRRGSRRRAAGAVLRPASRFKNLTFTGAYGRRREDVPTASFGTLFNEQQSPEQTTDRHTLADRRVRARVRQSAG